MNNLLMITATLLLILFGCSQEQEETRPETTDSVERQITEGVDSDNEVEAELDLVTSFPPFEEINVFVMDEETFASVYYEYSYNEDDDPSTWSLGNIFHSIKAEDGTIYYFSSFDHKEAGKIYEVYTFDENNRAEVVSEVYSPPYKDLIAEGTDYYGSLMMYLYLSMNIMMTMIINQKM